ncbi:hypothetical protein [Leekyejoonella antrihumi]|nr:hypothetical protein [Leekyejoonella antrihumi]
MSSSPFEEIRDDLAGVQRQAGLATPSRAAVTGPASGHLATTLETSAGGPDQPGADRPYPSDAALGRPSRVVREPAGRVRYPADSSYILG